MGLYKNDQKLLYSYPLSVSFFHDDYVYLKDHTLINRDDHIDFMKKEKEINNVIKFVLTLILVLISTVIWGFVSTLLFNSSMLTGVGAIIIGWIILTLMNKTEEDENEK